MRNGFGEYFVRHGTQAHRGREALAPLAGRDEDDFVPLGHRRAAQRARAIEHDAGA